MPSEFIWPLRVYYEDTDAGGVVFYANYLKFFERARTEWLRAAGIEQNVLADTERILFVVRSTGVDYHAPAKLDDELKLSVVVERMGRASVHFVQEAWREGKGAPQLLATGRIRVACVDADLFRPTAIPDSVLAKIQAPHQAPA
jgi:acyl-CoA thioester hydrolase